MRLTFAWSPALIVLIACGGEGTHSPMMSGGAASGGGEATEQAGGAQGGSSGSPVMGGNSNGGDKASGGGGTTSGGAPAAGSGGAGGNAGASGAGGKGGVGGGGAGGQGGMITTPEALVPIAKSFCTAARTCCMKEQLPAMLDDCESGYASKDDTAKALARGTVTLDSAVLARCLAAYQAAAQTCEERSVRDACRGVVHGTRAEGESCLMGSECAGDDAKACLVADSNPGTMGVCRKIPHGKVGDACQITCRPDDNCTWTSYGAAGDQPPTICFESEGVYCDTLSDTPKCQAIRAAGTACTDFDQCGSAGSCDTVARTCKRLAQLNEPCGMCIPQLTCIDGKCQSPSFTVGPTCEGVSFGPY